MVLFFPDQQELDCISNSGRILGKITFDGVKDEYVFSLNDASTMLSDAEKSSISQRLSGLNSGDDSIPMQDDD